MGIKDRTEIWNHLHDGFITGITQLMLNQISITVEIPYLCETFSTQSSSFNLILDGFRYISFEPFYEGETLTDFDKIAVKELQILEARDDGSNLIICVAEGNRGGDLSLQYSDVELRLENGVKVSNEELINASLLYWNNSNSK
jgi:hypothetical protein